MTAPSIVQRRIAIAALCCVLGFALIGVRLIDLTLLQAASAGAAVLRPHAVAARGDIVDRNGELLARDLIVHDLSVQPSLLPDKAAAAHELAIATGTDERRLVRDFARHEKPNQFVLVARQVTPDVQEMLIDLGLPGLEFDPAMRRYYPLGAAAGVLGQTDADGIGVTGIELGMDKQLRADRRVQLSLDKRIQYALSHEVDASRKQFSARAAGGIVMNVNTGEILAMTSLRDPAAPADPHDRGNPDRNRMLRDVHELGPV